MWMQMAQRSNPRKITKQGNSQGITIPVDVLSDAGLERGDRVVVESDGRKLVVEKVRMTTVGGGDDDE